MTSENLYFLNKNILRKEIKKIKIQENLNET